MFIRILSSVFFFFLMYRRPPRSTRTDTLFPYTTLFRSIRINGMSFLQILAGSTWEQGNFSAGLRSLSDKLKQREAFRDLLLPVEVHGEHRSEEHTSELQSLMRISYAVFCLQKKKRNRHHQPSDDFHTYDYNLN